ncbi:hypothetical protein GCM10023259_064560 [Thermocatellispora tengchongensis]
MRLIRNIAVAIAVAAIAGGVSVSTGDRPQSFLAADDVEGGNIWGWPRSDCGRCGAELGPIPLEPGK